MVDLRCSYTGTSIALPPSAAVAAVAACTDFFWSAGTSLPINTLMAELLTYTVLRIGPYKLHQLHTSAGKYFFMGEVATELFQQPPNAFVQELRKGKYPKTISAVPDVLQAVVQLSLEVEGSANIAGVMLLPPATVEALLQDKRRLDLLQSFKVAMLKLATQEAARLMAAGDYESALPVALEAVTIGKKLFKLQPALQLFPLYLLAAQANLGLRRAAQCERCLGLASMLAMKEPNMTTNTMRSQLSRLYGQLYALQSKAQEALQAFAEDVYYCSLEYGPQDAHTSLGYYNIAQVLQSTGETTGARCCRDMVVSIWSSCLQQCVLGCREQGQPLPPEAPRELPVGQLQLAEVVEMLQDIQSHRVVQLGDCHPQLVAVPVVKSLALLQLGDKQRAREELEAARQVLDGIKQQQPLPQQQQEPASPLEGVEQAQQMFDRLSAHLAKCCYKDNCVDGCC